MPELKSSHETLLFSRFFRENQKKYLTFAYSYLRDWEEAEDLFMESMITLWENRNRWDDDSNMNALLLTILKNKALNRLEHRQVRLRAEQEINTHARRELDLRIATLKACEPEQIFDTEIQQIVQKALHEMPEQSRRIFVLSRYQDLPNKQIAEQLGISLKTVEAHMTKALRILRQELKDYLASILL